MCACWRCPLEGAEATRLADEIDRKGYGSIVDFVSEQELQPLRAAARAAVDAAGGQYAILNQARSFAGTVLGELLRSRSLREICRRLYIRETGLPPPDGEFHAILRCLQGRTGQRNSQLFHYDSYVVTAVLPVAMPQTGPEGDLLIIPSARPVRRFYLRNLADKLAIDNLLSQMLFRFSMLRQRSRITVIRLVPGTMYFFSGYRSIHANQRCDPDQLRATAVFHYGDPHRNSRVRALIRAIRNIDRRSR